MVPDLPTFYWITNRLTLVRQFKAVEKILVSACLLGARVRYDGGDMYFDDTNLRRWIVEGRVVSVCPEVVAGLPVPRSASEIVGQGDGFGVLQGTARQASPQDGALRALCVPYTASTRDDRSGDRSRHRTVDLS